MKRMLFYGAVIIIFTASKAQITSGTFTYEQVTQMNIALPDGIELPDGFPTENRVEKMLTFNQEESIYKNAPTVEPEVNEMKTEGLHFKVKMETPDEQFYKNIVEGKSVEKRSLLDRDFLIEDELKTLKWKLTGDQKIILDYTCQKATTKRDTSNVIAWFAPELPIQNGPESYGQLPGMILEVNENNGYRVITATGFSENTEKIQAPKKGKKISLKAYEKLEAEKMAELRAQYGGSGGVIIKTQSIDN